MPFDRLGWTCFRDAALAALVISLTVIGMGCALDEAARQGTVINEVGKYEAGPIGAAKPHVGVLPFNVQGAGSFVASDELNGLAADQMGALLAGSDRFQVIERTQLQKMLEEQHLEGMLRAGEIARTAQVNGVEYLLLGRVIILGVKKETNEVGLMSRVGGWFGRGDGDEKKDKITTEAGVDLRLVDPTTAQVVVSTYSDYKRTDSAAAIGVNIAGASSEASTDLKIDEAGKSKILRLVLDDAFRKSLRKFDRFLVNGAKQEDSSPPPISTENRSVVPAAGASTPVAAKKLCAQCGHEVSTGTKFCPNCGAKVE